MQAWEAWRAWVSNSEEHPLAATLVSGLIVSRGSPSASSFPHTIPSHLLVPSRPRDLFCLRLCNSLASLHPHAHSPSPFLWNCPPDPTSDPLGTRRRYGRFRFCAARAWGKLWAEAGTRGDRLVLSYLACLALSCLNKLMQHSPTASAAISSRYLRLWKDAAEWQNI